MSIRSRKLRQPNSSDRADVGLEVTRKILSTLENVAELSPVPGLSKAAGLVLQMTETVQKVRSNKDAFRRLVADARDLVYVIFHTFEHMAGTEDVYSEMERSLDGVLKVLLSIQDLANEGASQGKFRAFWRTGVDADKIKQSREQLQQCFSKFGLESNIDTRLMLYKLASQGEKMMSILKSNDNPVPARGSRRDGGHVIKKEQQSRLEDGTEVGKGSWKTKQTITFGNNANFAGAFGIVIGSNNEVTTGRTMA